MKGPTFPLENDAAGKIATSNDTSVLARSWVRQFMTSRRGSRPMRPTWGAGLDGVLFEPNDQVAQALATRRIKFAEDHLPIVIKDVVFIPTESSEKMIPEVHFFVVGDMATEHVVTSEG
jgi:hypothetical protein